MISMNNSIIKMTLRSIRSFLGRYIAILLIVALGAGFFAGLKITKDAMWETCDIYLADNNFYDFRMMATIGFSYSDIDIFKEIDGVKNVEGMTSADALIDYEGGNKAVKFMSVPQRINLPSIKEGRMPEKANECVVDNRLYDEEDIGKLIKLSQDNNDATLESFETNEYKIVGIVDSPLYMGIERGTTNIGSGSLSGFIYIPKENFLSDIYTEINITLKETADIYSDEYDEIVDCYVDNVTTLCEKAVNERYNKILEENGLTPDKAELLGIDKPESFVLTRNENTGYVSFESDTSIISGIANVFPIFFIMIAMLVCMTTMTRMVDEERTQIGVLKALGFSNMKIMSKYLLYAGSATLIGWIVGFFSCTLYLPKIFWFAYNSIYDFADIKYIFSTSMAVITLILYLIGILGSTYFSCRKELTSVPANLIRPRATKNGKRILLERVKILWSRFSFLQKITIRNMFRYKKRFIMMIVGISCCTALLLTGFGIKDSMTNIADIQYSEIQKYNLSVGFETDSENGLDEKLDKMENIEEYIMCSSQYVDLVSDEILSSVNMLSFDELEKLPDFWDFHNGTEEIEYPSLGEAIINTKAAENLNVSVGDVIEIRDPNMNACKVTISAIFDNHISNFIFISKETYEQAFGKWSENTALVTANGDEVAIAEEINEIEEVTSVMQLSITKDAVGSALSSIDYIILLVIVFSATLAFIVIFNLTSINISERSREIATVQVLGFYAKETESYVLRENVILSVIASFIGLPLGVIFHRFVMSMVKIELVDFNQIIRPISYIYAIFGTVLFALIVNVFMKRQIGKIKMAESLKAVE